MRFSRGNVPLRCTLGGLFYFCLSVLLGRSPWGGADAVFVSAFPEEPPWLEQPRVMVPPPWGQSGCHWAPWVAPSSGVEGPQGCRWRPWVLCRRLGAGAGAQGDTPPKWGHPEAAALPGALLRGRGPILWPPALAGSTPALSVGSGQASQPRPGWGGSCLQGGGLWGVPGAMGWCGHRLVMGWGGDTRPLWEPRCWGLSPQAGGP